MTSPRHLVTFDGTSPRVSPETSVAPTASVLGDVDPAQDVSVFYGAVIRGDQARISVDVGTNIQDLVVIHADPGFPVRIGAGVSVGHGAVLHGCTIEDGCLIGMGAIVLNGAIIGQGTLVAAGALVLAGANIPPRSLVAGSLQRCDGRWPTLTCPR